MNLTLNGGSGSAAAAEPIGLEWQPPEVVGIDHTQKPIYSAYRTASLTFNTLTTAEFAVWVAADNGGYQTITGFPTPSGASTATYTNVIIRRKAGSIGPLGYIYGAAFDVERLVP